MCYLDTGLRKTDSEEYSLLDVFHNSKMEFSSLQESDFEDLTFLGESIEDEDVCERLVKGEIDPMNHKELSLRAIDEACLETLVNVNKKRKRGRGENHIRRPKKMVQVKGSRNIKAFFKPGPKITNYPVRKRESSSQPIERSSSKR